VGLVFQLLTLVVPSGIPKEDPESEVIGKKFENESVLTASERRKFGRRARWLVRSVSEAFLNPGKFPIRMLFNANFIFISVYIPWDAEEYYLDCVKGARDKSRIKFPNPKFGDFSRPLTLVDTRGRIVLWYLPRLLCLELQVSVYDNLSQSRPTHL
jgi:hypothetical protein